MLAEQCPFTKLDTLNKVQCGDTYTQECSQKRSDLDNTIKSLRFEITESERLLKKTSRDVQLLEEQERGLHERIRDLEVQNAENKMDPAHLASLEKQVQLFQKGVLPVCADSYDPPS